MLHEHNVMNRDNDIYGLSCENIVTESGHFGSIQYYEKIAERFLNTTPLTLDKYVTLITSGTDFSLLLQIPEFLPHQSCFNCLA